MYAAINLRFAAVELFEKLSETQKIKMQMVLFTVAYVLVQRVEPTADTNIDNVVHVC